MEFITPEEMRRLEVEASTYGLRTVDLMENAGRAVAEIIESRYGRSREKSVLVVCGPGNNGGDGFVTARCLSMRGWRTRLILLAEPEVIRTEEARENWRALGDSVERAVASDLEALLEHAGWVEGVTVIVDAILGTGVKGEIREPLRTAIQLINESHAIRVAVDIPSGVDPGNGEIRGFAIRADLTIALHQPKIGLRERKEYTGELISVSIGMKSGVR